MGEAKLHLVLVEEVLGHRALHRLPVLQLEREALHLCRAPRHVADAILALHRAAVGDLDLEPLDLLGELDAHGVGERLALVLYIPNVQDLQGQGVQNCEGRRCFVAYLGFFSCD